MLAADGESTQGGGYPMAPAEGVAATTAVAAAAPRSPPAAAPAPAPAAAVAPAPASPAAAAPAPVAAAAAPQPLPVASPAPAADTAAVASSGASPSNASAPATAPAEAETSEAPAALPADTGVAEDAPASNDEADGAAASTSFSSGIIGKFKEKVGTAVEKVSEMESVQKGTQFVVDKTKVVQQKLAESERVQHGVEFVKKKTTELAESERVQHGVEFVKKKTTELAESERVQKGLERAKDAAKVVQEKTQKSVEVVSEKAQQGIEYAKEKTKAVREATGTVWQRGRGNIEVVKASVSKIAWRGSARDTLDIAAREEQWKNIKVQGAEELSVPARTEHTSTYHVAKGSTLRWTFRVKDHDIGFGVRVRVQEWGGSKEEEVLAVERYDSADTVSGSWVADEDRTMVLAFDNRYSKLRSKTVAYLVGTEKPPIFSEPKAEAAATVDAAPRPIV